MKPLLPLVAVALGLATVVSAGPEAIECWFVEDAGGGSLSKKPATLLLRHGPRGPPPRADVDPKLYFKVDDPAGMLLAAFRRYPAGASVPHCEISRFIPFPASAKWTRSLIPQPNCPRALDGDWLLASVSSTVFSLSCLLRPQPEPQREPVSITMATVVLTVLTQNPAPRIQLGKDAVLDLRFAYAPTDLRFADTPTALKDAPSVDAGPPPFGLEWRRQHRGKGHLLLAATPGLVERMPPAQEQATAFAAWDDNEPWGPWTGNGTFWLPAVKPSQEGVYLATVHLPYLQGQVSLKLTVHKPPRVSLTPAPVVWAAPGEAPPELLCLASHFYPVEGLKVEWEVRGGPEGSSRTAEGKTWLSTIRHHSDGSVSQAGHLQPPPVSAKQHGVRYACRVHHPSLPASGRSAVVTLEVAGFSGPSMEDGIGLFLSAFFLLGLIRVLGWLAAHLTIPEVSKEKATAASLTIPRYSKKSQ
ncbi:tapasin [Mastomys coucha]|uniref:tapasin n=1 Tax=Mastomys coucha TaxID=35658 RepID=UPI0012622811|nr:tapasin [Mastomys coucha]